MAVPQIDPLPQPPSRDNPANFAALADIFLATLAAAFPAQANAVATFASLMATQAAASAASAVNAPGTSATSATQLTIGAGSKTLAIQTGKAFAIGQFVSIAQTTTPGNWMVGQITAHDATAGSLTVQVLGIGGAGTASAWTIGLSAPMRFFAAAAKDIWAGTDSTLVATPPGLAAAAVPQALVDAATITPDMAAGLNFTLTLAGSRTLANPANAQAGDSGVIVVTQDGTGSRALAYGSTWKFPGGAPALSTAVGAIDVISYLVISPTVILCTLVRSFR